jgi:hypothetical protein
MAEGGQSNIAVTLSLPSGTTAIHHVGTTAKDDAYYSLTARRWNTLPMEYISETGGRSPYDRWFSPLSRSGTGRLMTHSP